jgi:peptidoglycan/xylan/chitin deacetylase (PgdA/CDA1 family)
MLQSHLRYVSQNYTTVFPAQNITCKDPICLVFDDGYFDFYKYIFPLLEQYNLKALLAVSPKFILEKTQIPDNERLAFEHNDLYENYEKATFCTYEELDIMARSGHVQIASHSYSHVNLLQSGVDLTQELKGSQEVLEQKLGVKVESFVFPYGKYSQHILDETKKYYPYAFRIGNAINDNFDGVKGVIYRIDADNLQAPDAIFKFMKMLKYRYKKFIKTLVGNG